MQWLGLGLVLLSLFGVCFWIDPTVMAERHHAYREGFRAGYYNGLRRYRGTNREAFDCGYTDGQKRRSRDNIGR